LEIDHPGYILCALDGGEAIFREPGEVPQNVIELPGAMEISPPPNETMH
jgi:hypothetical protein